MPEPINPREPLDGATLVNHDKKFSPQCLAALREFKRKKPWRGTLDERQAKFGELHAALADAYGLAPPPALEFLALGQAQPDQMGDGGFDPEGNRIVLAGRLSVSTYLWSFARARGQSVEEAFRWSLSLFARVFPRSFENCHFEGPYLVKDDNQNL
jgi:hypothetical protein